MSTENFETGERALHELLREARVLRATSFHLDPAHGHGTVRFRTDGEMGPARKLSDPDRRSVLNAAVCTSNLDPNEQSLPQDGRVKLELDGQPLDLSIAIVPSALGTKLTVRLHDPALFTRDLDELGMVAPDIARFSDALSARQGLIVVTGPTGSGTTTTLYAALKRVAERGLSVATAEDPIGRVIPGLTQVRCRPEIGLTFATILKTMLRHDQDAVMVGEIRDYETAEIASRSAHAGILVLAGMPVNEATGVFGRMQDMGIEAFKLAESVTATLAQRLVRTICIECREPWTPERVMLESVGLDPDRVSTLYRGAGCVTCHGSGLAGRTGVFEVLRPDAAFRNKLIAGGSMRALRRAAGEAGMVTMRQAALAKAVAGTITLDEVVVRTYPPDLEDACAESRP